MHPFVLGQGSGPCSGHRFCEAGCLEAPLPRDQSALSAPVPLSHRFRAAQVISLLRALVVTIIGLPAASVRPGRPVASVRASHSLGEPFFRNPSFIPFPPQF